MTKKLSNSDSFKQPLTSEQIQARNMLDSFDPFALPSDNTAKPFQAWDSKNANLDAQVELEKTRRKEQTLSRPGDIFRFGKINK